MPSVRTQGRAPYQSFWKGAPRPLLVLVIYIVGVAAVALIGGIYAPRFVRDAPPTLLPLAWLTSSASPAFAFALQSVAAVALLLLPVQVLDAMINRIVQQRRSLFSPPDDDAVVEEVSSSQPIVAWRVWSLRGDTLKGFCVFWPDRVLDAECPRCVEVPGVRCTCGIYAFKEGDQRWEELFIYGRVELSGIVIEHELGYRAQRVRILELWAPDFWTAAALERRYGCIVHTLK